MQEKQKQQKSEQEMPSEVYRLAEVYRLGQPLAFYGLPSPWLRLILQVPRILQVAYVVFIGIFLLKLIVEIISFVQLQMPHTQEQDFLLSNDLLVGLLALLILLCIIIILRVMVWTVPHMFPKYFLACNEGLLCVYTGDIEVTRWEEMTRCFRTSRHYYRLIRVGRKPLAFGYPTEHVEELADLVKEHIHQTNTRGL